MVLKNTHKKLKKSILFYFSACAMQLIPETNFSIIDKAKVLIYPILLGMSVFFTSNHLLFQLTSLEKIVDFVFNFNLTIVGIQTSITFITVNIVFKRKFFTVLNFFDDIVNSYVSFLTNARMYHLESSISIAWRLVR